jgi:uncharacterized protein (TIRG00374 family)
VLRRWGRRLVWPAALLLVALSLRSVDWREVRGLLAAIAAWQWMALLAVNTLILLIFSGRWWSILTGLGRRIGYVRLSGFRLAGFAVSYFTPGTQFGGEPVQIHLLAQRERVPGVTATASVALDKALEVIANSTFLAFGVVISLRLQILQSRQAIPLGAVAGVLLLIPLGLLWAWLKDRRPLSALARELADRWSRRWAKLAMLRGYAEETEAELVRFCQQQPRPMVLAMGFSMLSYAGMVAERWLMLRFLGVELAPAQTIAVVTASRLAFLLPLPAALGALEASQILALEALGLDAATGAALALIIRLRDILFGGLGLILGGRWLRQGPAD